MGIFTQVDEISELTGRLGALVRRRFYEVAKMDAEEIAEVLIDERGLEEVCMDIEEALSEADDMIHESADSNIIYDFDNYLLATFDPYPENQEVDDYSVKEAACSEEPEMALTRAVQVYAYELWKAGIRNALKKILEEKCAAVRSHAMMKVR